MELLQEVLEDVFGEEDVVNEVEPEWQPGMPMPTKKPEMGDHDAAIARSGDRVHSLHVQSAPMEHYAD